MYSVYRWFGKGWTPALAPSLVPFNSKDTILVGNGGSFAPYPNGRMLLKAEGVLKDCKLFRMKIPSKIPSSTKIPHRPRQSIRPSTSIICILVSIVAAAFQVLLAINFANFVVVRNTTELLELNVRELVYILQV
jgi:hypothetical protein